MARRLFCTLRSPFARKVSIALAEKGLAVEPIIEDLGARSAAFVGVSPIGKVPVLVDEDGTVVIDSTIICEYLEDRYPTPPLCQPGWRNRLDVRQVDELGDSVAEQAIAIAFKRGDVAKAEGVLARLLDVLEARADVTGAPLCGTFSWADASVLSGLGYLTFRLGDSWRHGHPRLAAWYDAMDERPSAAATRPRL
jgi:glutathione S-transferase